MPLKISIQRQQLLCNKTVFFLCSCAQMLGIFYTKFCMWLIAKLLNDPKPNLWNIRTIENNGLVAKQKPKATD